MQSTHYLRRLRHSREEPLAITTALHNVPECAYHSALLHVYRLVPEDAQTHARLHVLEHVQDRVQAVQAAQELVQLHVLADALEHVLPFVQIIAPGIVMADATHSVLAIVRNTVLLLAQVLALGQIHLLDNI